MKRLLPILIILCLLGAVFTCLPKSESRPASITTLDDLANAKVGIQSGLNYELFLAEAYPDAEPVIFSEFPSIFSALQQGKISALLTESISYPVEKAEIPSLEKIEEPLSSIECYLGVRNDGQNSALLSQLNEFIEECLSDGTHDEMVSYWYDNYDCETACVDKSGITGENGTVSFTAEASYEPVCFAGKSGELQGFEVDFAYRFCRKYGYEPKITPLEFDAMSAALVSGRVDVAMGLIKDEERAEEIAFSEAYYYYDIIAVYDSGASAGEGFLEGLADSFNKTFIRENRWTMFLKGSGVTLLIAALSVLFGTVLGLLLYLWCSHGKKLEHTVVSVLCWLMSSTPTVVLLMILYYIIFNGYLISNIAVAVIGFSLLFGCGFYERIVSGVKAVGTEQEEAARAQGFSRDQAFFRIIFPQAMNHFMPAYEGDMISLIQETSVVGYIAVMDLTKMSDLVRSRTYQAFFPLLATAGIYFLLIWLLTILIRRVTVSANSKNRKKEKVLRGIKISSD